MQTTEVTPDLIQLTRLRAVNCYLVRETDGLTLIDTMIPGSAGDILAAAERAGAPIRRIALTHGHSDHVGSLDALREKLGSEVEVLIPRIDWRVLQGERTVEGRKVKGGWPKLDTRPDVELEAGMRVGSLEVHATPGHTPGHVAFLDTRDRSLIAGDTFATIGGLYVTSHFALPFPLPALAAWDPAQVRSSARVLRELDPTVVTVGHGGAVRSPGAVIDRALERADKAAR